MDISGIYETDLEVVREAAVRSVMLELSNDTDPCQHDMFTFCPSALCRVISLFNIYPMDLYQRILGYVPLEEMQSLEEYWRHFINHLVRDPNDFQVRN